MDIYIKYISDHNHTTKFTASNYLVFYIYQPKARKVMHIQVANDYELIKGCMFTTKYLKHTYVYCAHAMR